MMANLLKIHNGNIICNLTRKLSSFNNNRTKTGLISIIPNSDIIWSETNWSEFGKQFNSNRIFPLPGNIGILVELKQETIPKKILNLENSKQNIIAENLDHLLYNPLPEELQYDKLRIVPSGLELTNMDNKDVPKEAIKPVFELKAYNCPKSLMNDFQNYFRLKSISDSPISVITVSFKTMNDMSLWNQQVDTEREILTEQFVKKAQEICQLFESEGFWADYIDPSSGSLNKSPFTDTTFYETDERYRHLGFEIIDNGCCKVISHHEWGTKSYVGCIVTNATTNGKFLQEIINK